MEKTVVMGFLGPVMDVGRGNGRWEKRENLDRHHLLNSTLMTITDLT
jgi:sigma54-dependent transcription regulator